MAISNLHAALLCSPGMGHIIPALELAKRLVTHHVIPTLTFFHVSIKNTTSQAEAKVLQSAMKDNIFNIIHLPPLDITDLVDPKVNQGMKLAILMQQTAPLLSSAISSMTSKPTILITDLFGSQALHVAEEFKMSKYVFFTSNAWNLALTFYTPTLDKEIKGQYLDQPKPLQIPGCHPIHPMDLFAPLQDRTQQLYHEYLRMCKELALADGVLVNTFLELEAKTLAALSSGEITKVPVYPIGPLIRETDDDNEQRLQRHVFDWLEKQEAESVIYVSFGSGYRMTYEQIKELASGLELSGTKFVWCVRPPVTKAGDDHYLTAGEVVSNQNVLESVSCGVPMVGWPLFAEQRMNAAMLTEEVGIAVRVEVPLSTHVVGREEIAKAIRKIMDKDDREGGAIRKRVKELKDVAERAWSKDGSAYLELPKIAYAFSVKHE
ncbi:UDP-glucuronosyl/UDP-glucosyltransferase [Sesbania bispinosa]|nr:UDP-glucuronosyl/UDP-glucosyltransferase [Sesbania bispinosa]